MERTKRPAKSESASPQSTSSARSDGRVEWVNTGGNLFLKGKLISRKERFLAHPNDIPKAFRDVVRPVEPLPVEPTLPAPAGGYESRKRADGMFDIVDANGKVVNDKPMSEVDAKSILSKLN